MNFGQEQLLLFYLIVILVIRGLRFVSSACEENSVKHLVIAVVLLGIATAVELKYDLHNAKQLGVVPIGLLAVSAFLTSSCIEEWRDYRCKAGTVVLIVFTVIGIMILG